MGPSGRYGSSFGKSSVQQTRGSPGTVGLLSTGLPRLGLVRVGWFSCPGLATPASHGARCLPPHSSSHARAPSLSLIGRFCATTRWRARALPPRQPVHGGGQGRVGPPFWTATSFTLSACPHAHTWTPTQAVRSSRQYSIKNVTKHSVCGFSDQKSCTALVTANTPHGQPWNETRPAAGPAAGGEMPARRLFGCQCLQT